MSYDISRGTNYILQRSDIINNQKQLKKRWLENYDQKQKTSILLKENNVVVNDHQELINYIYEALEDKTKHKNLHLGVIPNETIKRIINEITDINPSKIKSLFNKNIKYALAINQDEIRHLKKKSLSINDVVDFITNLDRLIINFDTVRYTVYNNNQSALRFKKRMHDGTYIALEVISNKNHTLRTQTLFLEKADFKKKKRNLSPTPDE